MRVLQTERPADLAKQGRVRRWLREPFVHFIGIGIALFLLYALVSPPRAPVLGYKIVLTEDDLRQIDLAWTAKWQRPPTVVERQTLLADKVREEVLYREAIAMGLDQQDTIIKRRMAQKLEFLTEDVGAVRSPTTQELKTWFSGNKDKFKSVGYVTFRHLYFSPDLRGPKAKQDATTALRSLMGQPVDGEMVANLGDRFPDKSYFAEQSQEQIANVFGTSFAEAVQTLTPGAWQGPVESGLGWHLVWVDSIAPGHVPAFEEVDRNTLETEWIDTQRAESKRSMYEAMRAKYELVLPAAESP